MKRLALILALAAFPAWLQAGPPFVTDDPEPVDFQHWEINLGTQLFHAAGGWSGSLAQADINYGAYKNLQLHIQPEIPFQTSSSGPTAFGYSNVELGVKYRFIDETPSCPQVAVYPLLELPTGNVNEGLGAGHPQAFLPVWLQKSFGKWTTFGGGGYGINPGPTSQNWWFIGCVLQRQVTDHFSLGAEIYHETAQDRGVESNTAMNLGGTWEMSENYQLLFSGGHTVQGPPGYQSYIAIRFAFGPK